MALSIKTEEADRLARQLAAATGETMTEAVTRALEERLKRVTIRKAAKRGDLAAEIEKAAAEIRSKYDLDGLTAEEVEKAGWDGWDEEVAKRADAGRRHVRSGRNPKKRARS